MLRLMENRNDVPVELLTGNSRQVVGKDGLVPRSGEVDLPESRSWNEERQGFRRVVRR